MDHNMTSPEPPYLIGVVGDQASLASFLAMLRSGMSQASLARVNLVAAALPRDEPSQTPPELGIPVYPTFREMLYMHPEINLLVETSGLPKLLKTLRRDLPSHVILVERAAASFFLHLLSTEQMWAACQIDLLTTQNMLRAIIDQLNEDLLFLDYEGMVLNANRSACQRTGLEKRELVGRHWREAFENMEIHCRGGKLTCPDPFERTLETKEAAEALGTSVDPFGRMHYYRVYSYPIFEQNQLNRVVIMRRDITSRTEMENRLQQSEKLASIGELSTYIAHEIRNPLFAISGFANSLLRSEALDESSREKLAIILEESRRLDEILKSLLNFTRPTEQRQGLCDVNRIASEALEVLGIGARAQNVNILFEPYENLPKAMADPDPIKQCIINLIKNSLEAMPNGGTLTLRTTLRQDRIVVSVEDTGTGIPSEILSRVFNPFFSTKGKGAGLGLAMIRKIMDDIGGDVELTSRENVGTIATLLLPPLLAVAQSEVSG
ncbi:MAG: ATP-binding protein [Desulfovibrionaceae bacterium]